MFSEKVAVFLNSPNLVSLIQSSFLTLIIFEPLHFRLLWETQSVKKITCIESLRNCTFV